MIEGCGCLRCAQILFLFYGGRLGSSLLQHYRDAARTPLGIQDYSVLNTNFNRIFLNASRELCKVVRLVFLFGSIIPHLNNKHTYIVIQMVLETVLIGLILCNQLFVRSGGQQDWYRSAFEP